MEGDEKRSFLLLMFAQGLVLCSLSRVIDPNGVSLKIPSRYVAKYGGGILNRTINTQITLLI